MATTQTPVSFSSAIARCPTLLWPLSHRITQSQSSQPHRNETVADADRVLPLLPTYISPHLSHPHLSSPPPAPPIALAPRNDPHSSRLAPRQHALPPPRSRQPPPAHSPHPSTDRGVGLPPRRGPVHPRDPFIPRHSHPQVRRLCSRPKSLFDAPLMPVAASRASARSRPAPLALSRRSSSPTAVRSPSESSVPPTSWPCRQSPSTRSRTA